MIEGLMSILMVGMIMKMKFQDCFPKFSSVWPLHAAHLHTSISINIKPKRNLNFLLASAPNNIVNNKFLDDNAHYNLEKSWMIKRITEET